VHTIASFGRFPKQQRFHNRAIGWAKRAVAARLTESARFPRLVTRARRRPDSPALLQQSLPMHFPRTRRALERCASKRKGGRS
jgi:hypothetical protein